VSVAYVKSLAKLTNQVAIVDAKVNMDQRNVVNINAPKVLMIIE
jgi:hypothetical protein